ncbi:MAG: alanine racemase [Pseudomonadota bacterium]
MVEGLTARLSIDTDAIARNWRAMNALSAPDCETAAVVKGDGYGCGAVRVGKVLAQAGARTFFVALPSEGVTLREGLGPDPVIYILGGYGRAEMSAYRQADLRPVLNSAQQTGAWLEDVGGPAAIQLDTGMNRLGMEADELASLPDLPDTIDLVISHMGNADAPEHPLNEAQLVEFQRLSQGMDRRLSLSATAGVLLGADYHFAMTRPGIGLYGGWPFAAAERVVTLEAPIIQIRDVQAGESIGYGATWVAQRPSQIATISAGYADGLIRYLSHGATTFVAGQPAPLAGRVSMDLITLDVTGVGAKPGDMVELLGPNQSIDDLAANAGTIGHEILTSLGGRYARP